MNIKEKINKLKEEGHTIYSISRLNTVDECGWEYWQTYKEHLAGKDNIYGFTGTRIHKCLEDIQNGIKVDFPKEIEKMLAEAQMLDITFPTENIETKWKKDIISFAHNYVAPTYNKVETEKLFLVEINGHYLQGIIDLLIYNEDGAMEQMGYKVKDLAWEMLKYVEISYKLKNGKIRNTIAERGYILEKLKSDITKELKALKQYDGLQIEMMVDEAIENNSFDNLPQSIRDKYTIKDYICYYDFTEERKRETQAFIQAKIEDIEMFEDNKNWWEPKEITPYTSFYCQNLCRSSQSL